MTEISHCRFAGSNQPRVLSGRHVEDCEDESCRGCQPCPMAHCRCCGITHAEQTCAACVGAVREDLAEIRRMCDALPEEVAVRGVDGEAMNLLGPAVNAEARGHWEASVLAGRILPPECDARELDDVRVWLESADDERHPLLVLGTWSLVYRDAFGHDEPSGRSGVAAEAGYLERNLTEAGDEAWVPFEDFARDVRACVAHMERVLHDGEQIEKGAPCPTCKKPLERRYGYAAKDDRWLCLTRTCEVEDYTTAQYTGWVQDDALKGADRLTATDMARRFVDDNGMALVKPGEVRVWGSRELVKKRGKNDHGVTLYDVEQVAQRIKARRAEDAA